MFDEPWKLVGNSNSFVWVAGLFLLLVRVLRIALVRRTYILHMSGDSGYSHNDWYYERPEAYEIYIV